MIYIEMLRELLEELGINPDKFTNLEACRLTEIYNRHITALLEPIYKKVDEAYDAGKISAELEHENDYDDGYSTGRADAFQTLTNLIADELERHDYDADNPEYVFFSRMDDWTKDRECEITE